MNEEQKVWRIPCEPEGGLLEIREPTSLKERMLIRAQQELDKLRQRVVEVEAERDNAEMALVYLHQACKTSRWPITAEQMTPMTTASMVLSARKKRLVRVEVDEPSDAMMAKIAEELPPDQFKADEPVAAIDAAIDASGEGHG